MINQANRRRLGTTKRKVRELTTILAGDATDKAMRGRAIGTSGFTTKESMLEVTYRTVISVDMDLEWDTNISILTTVEESLNGPDEDLTCCDNT
jgi:hypothetical protein